MLLALEGYALISSITPGPNNMMLMTSGANFGYRRTIPHMLGILIGFVTLTVLNGLWLMTFFKTFPSLRIALVIFSTFYILWLAWKISQSSKIKKTAAKAKPLTFVQGALFQWINPKAWQMGISAFTLYAQDNSLISVFLVAAGFALVSFPCASVWTVLGQKMVYFLSTPRRLAIFNWTMAILLVATLIPVLSEYFPLG